ncbi:hypothetical protein PTKIN_Ptkin09bG0147300 [Pterospermum kingtungense]
MDDDASLSGLLCLENVTFLEEKEELIGEQYLDENDTREVFGFRFQIAFVSIFYFDRFLSGKSIDSEKSWAMQLLSMACLSLAVKMEEGIVPALSEFQAEEFNFETKLIQRMELLESPPHLFVSKTVQFILGITREINLMEHRPFVIAAAATLRAFDERLTRKRMECTMNSISYCGFLEIEDIFSCYNLMQKLEMGKLNIPKSVNSPELSPQHLRAINVLGSSSTSAAVCTKRKRLTFHKSDNSDDLPNEKRPC